MIHGRAIWQPITAPRLGKVKSNSCLRGALVTTVLHYHMLSYLRSSSCFDIIYNLYLHKPLPAFGSMLSVMFTISQMNDLTTLRVRDRVLTYYLRPDDVSCVDN